MNERKSRFEDDSMWDTLTSPDGTPKNSREEAETPSREEVAVPNEVTTTGVL